MAGDISRENGKKGGRKPGRKNDATLEREAVLEAYRQRAMGIADQLFNSQATLARGMSYLMVVKTVKTKSGNGRTKSERQKPEVVESPEIIKAYLDGELDEKEDEYYYITTVKPEHTAIEGILDRTFGRPKTMVELGGPGGKPLPKTTIKIMYPDGYQRNSVQAEPKAS